ncbi:AtpZ/AtpI family protein [Allorhodopirellula solitaria]|uniref:Putative F0F1-ATPase subunit n=1 Tax=Allorhodopirellula solitaria TaxID=2527987 RepID=A0A5C5XTG9_9BACT|nr:AtpZ/AtpI family protein [Allorhodopirellula solitaria]TWT65978.1 putative F0F1-ATPase subunit [Allorhodopirellula solitaria]
MTDSTPPPPNSDRDSPGKRERMPDRREPEDMGRSETPSRRGDADSRIPVARERQSLLRLASAGLELASFSLILGGAGYAVDHWMDNSTPYIAIAGMLLGFCLGFYRLIVLASKMN